jgi:hypothetical protein
MTEESTSIRVRIDDQGYTHVTVIQWDEDGKEIVYREDETFQCSGGAILSRISVPPREIQ